MKKLPQCCISFLFCSLLGLYSSVVFSDVSMPPGAVAHWMFDDELGSTALDSMGSYNGSLVSGTTWGDGLISGALLFNGQNQTRLTADAPDNMAEFTACAWVNPNSLTNAGSDSLIYILEKNYSLRFNNEGSVSFTIPSTSSYPSVKSSINIAVNTWQHICGVYHGVGTAPEIYIDGENKSIDGNAGSGSQANDDYRPLYLGGQSNQWGGNFDGKLDDVIIYSHVLSAAEIQDIYSASTDDTSTAAPPAGLVDFWNFDEETGNVVTDSIGTNDGSLINGVTRTTGKINGALFFDGHNQTRLSVDAPDNMPEFTVCSWVNPSSLTNVGNDSSINIFDKNYTLHFNNIGRLSFIVPSTSAYPSVKSSINISTNTWQHICAVYYGVSIAPDLYIDGQNKSIDGKAGSGYQANDSYREFHLGGNNNQWAGNLEGKLDEVQVYERALTSIEIQGLYSPGGTVEIIPTYPAGAVAHWELNDESGPSAIDSIGTYNGSLVSGTTWTDGLIGGALLFNGQNRTRLTADAPDNMAEFTACAWVKPNSLTNAGSDNPIYILEKNYSLRFNSEGKVSFTVPSTSSYPSVQSSINIVVNTWQHICAIYHGVGTAPSIYIDGQNRSTNGNAGSGSQANDDYRPLYLGGQSNQWGGNFDGKLDDVIIYEQALSTVDIQEIYNVAGNTVTYQCSDSIDNDGDGLIDFPNDIGCSSVTDNDESDAPIDNTAPVLSNASPTGSLVSGTTSATISLQSNENANCKFSTTANVNFSAMSNVFTNTGGTTHSAIINGLFDGESKQYYARCTDPSGNTTTVDYVIAFLIALPADTVAPSMPLNLSTTSVTSSQVTLSWSASTDNVGVAGYKVYRDGVEIADTTETLFTDSTVLAETIYLYSVKAYDQASNYSALSVALTVETAAPQLAFPNAEGFGAYSIGGRGGTIVRVTNLNDSGPGSFREAVQASSRNYPNGAGTSWTYEPYDQYIERVTADGHRIVVFDVSGIINLENSLTISYPFLTIAGQTSPGGILIAGRQTTIKTHDIIMQHMRFRVGSHRIADGVDPETLDSFDIWGNSMSANAQDAYNIIIDHCSFSWGVDETFSTAYNPRNITVQNSIISEGLSHAGHPKGEHSKGMLIWGKYSPDLTMSIHHNYFAHNYARNPLINSGNTDRPMVDVTNNVVYNWFGGSVMGSGGYVRVNWRHNFAQRGESSNQYAYEISHPGNGLSPLPTIYVEGNMNTHRVDQSYDDWAVSIGWQYTLQDQAWERPTPWPAPVVTMAEASYNNSLEILQDVGATRPFRDSVDVRVLADFAAGTGHIIDNISYPGDFPAFQNLPIAIDMDNDGMSDNWETTAFGNLSQSSHADHDGDGYTNIEEYLHYLGQTLP